MADDLYSYSPDPLDGIADDENVKLGISGLMSPAPAQSLVLPPPNTPPKTGSSQTTPQTGTLNVPPQQAQPKVSGAPMIPGIATKPETLQRQMAQSQQAYNSAQPVNPGMPSSIGATTSMPSLQNAAQPSVVPDKLNMRTQQDQDKLAQLQSQPSGGSQIQNRWGRILAKVGDVAGSVLAPNVTQYIPGSTLNKQREVGIQQGIVNADQGQQQASAQLQDTQSQTQQRNAVADQNAAKAQSEQPRAVTQAEAEAAGKPALAGSVQRPVDIQRLIDARKAAYGKDQIITGADGGQYRIDPLNPTVAQPITGPDGKPIMGAPKAQQKVADNDKYIQIVSKPAGQRTPEDNAWLSAFRQLNKETKIDPGVQRAEIFVGGRAVQTLDPNDPTRVVYQTANQAERNGSTAPASIDFQAQKGVAKDFTSGPDARTVTAYNTAQQHLVQLGQAADALQNGNLQIANRIGQAYSEQTGNPAPTNFDAVRSAVSGEVSKVFKSSGATDTEIAEIAKNISKQNSPAQLKGVIRQYSHLLDSKRQALQQQYTQGMQGQPNFSPGSSVLIRKGNGQPISQQTAQQYLQKAGGDPAKARSMAQKDGWKF